MSAATARNVPALLQALREEEFTGTVRVSGSPGGTIHLRDGLVGAIETPGAPNATSALLTPGRIDDETWLTACASEPDADRLGAHLVSAGLIGAAELEIVCTATVFDGAFAMALSPPGSWETGAREPTLVAAPGVEPRALTEEATRRMGLLARVGVMAGELARARPELAGEWSSDGAGASGGPGGMGGLSGFRGSSGSDGLGELVGAVGARAASGAPGGRRPEPWLSGRHRELLGGVNGRRTPRDLAFAQGRGLYAVMLDLSRLEALGLIRWGAGTAGGDRPSTAPRVTPKSPTATGPAPAGAPLPKRRPGRSPAWDRRERGEKGG